MKLVRDLIPDIVAAKGETEPFRQVTDVGEHDRLLDEKVIEELGEWQENRDPHELADLLGVVKAHAYHWGIEWDDVEQLEHEKRGRCGGFEAGVVWLGGGDA